MNFDLSKLSPDRANVPYIGYGSGQVLKINSIELKRSVNTGSPKAILHMETKPISTEGFVPVDGAKGKVGKVAASIYMKDDGHKKEFLRKLKNIATALGLEEKVNEVKGDSFDQVVTKIEGIICGDRYAKYTLFAEEYPKNDGKVGVSLYLPKSNFVEPLETDPSTIVEFNKENPFHFKRLPRAGAQEGLKEDPVSDLPF